jgi:3-hydroxymyristoyl/3-hydroxydecanoyl-(acyl carrier protein) dehydratase
LRPSSADRGWITVDHQFVIDHPAAKGHFPGNPIIPGAVLLDCVVRAVGERSAAPIEIIHAKFLRPVRPGTLATLRWQSASDGSVKFECRLGEELALSGALRSRELPS